MSDAEVVIVTGAAGNLGAALCGVLARRGCRVVAVDRDAVAIGAHLSAPPALVVAPADLTDPAGCAEVVARTTAELGPSPAWRTRSAASRWAALPSTGRNCGTRCGGSTC